MDEQKKVYIVTAGQYSDYRIICVFSDEDEANTYAARHNQTDTWSLHQVEDYVLDAARPVDRTGMIAYHVSYMVNPNTPPHHPSPWSIYGQANRTILPFEHVHYEDSLHVENKMIRKHWQTWVWAKDKDEALKIAADRMMPVLAEMQIEGVEYPVGIQQVGSKRNEETVNGE